MVVVVLVFLERFEFIIIIAYDRRKRFLAQAYNITLQTECTYICTDDKSGTSFEKHASLNKN